jgi:hypothetical protein
VIKSRIMGFGWACSMYGRNEKCVQNFRVKMEGRDRLEDMGVNERTLE